MTRGRVLKTLLAILAALAIFLWGVAVGSFRLFPFDWLWSAGNQLDRSVEGPFINPHAMRAARDDQWLKTDADIVMLGDSMTAGGRWNEMLPDHLVANRGIPGDTVGGIQQRLPAIIALKPEQLVLMIGINDIMAGNDVRYISLAYQDIIQTLTPHTRLILMSTLSCRAPLCDAGKIARVRELNTQIKAIAAQHNLVFVDLNTRFAPAGPLDARLTDDGLHLNGEGYRLWQEMLELHVNSATQKSPGIFP